MSKVEKVKPQPKTKLRKKAKLDVNKMQNMRIIQKNLIYVIGLSESIADREILRKTEYFGQYGEIQKIVVNKNKVYNLNGPNGPSYSAYITFGQTEAASLAILALDNTVISDHLLRASFGTTKYCTYFLKDQECPNKECLYLHYEAKSEDVIHRDDMNSHTNVFYEQQVMAIRIANIMDSDVRKRLLGIKKGKSVFPHPSTILQKEVVLEKENEKTKKVHSNSFKNKRLANEESLSEDLDSRKASQHVVHSEEESFSYSQGESKESNTRKTSENIEYLSNDEVKKNSLFTRKMYQPRKSSRFQFTEENEQNLEEIAVPEFVKEIISKISSRHSFFKNCKFDNLNIFSQELKDLASNANSWAEFLISDHKNLEIQDSNTKLSQRLSK